MRPPRQLTQSQPMLAEDTGQRAWNGQPEAGRIRTSVLVGREESNRPWRPECPIGALVRTPRRRPMGSGFRWMRPRPEPPGLGSGKGGPSGAGQKALMIGCGDGRELPPAVSLVVWIDRPSLGRPAQDNEEDIEHEKCDGEIVEGCCLGNRRPELVRGPSAKRGCEYHGFEQLGPTGATADFGDNQCTRDQRQWSGTQCG
jgi:hypothetical protein